MPYSAKGIFEDNECIAQVLLMLDLLFTQDSRVEDLFRGAPTGPEPACSTAIIPSAWDLSFLESFSA